MNSLFYSRSNNYDMPAEIQLTGVSHAGTQHFFMGIMYIFSFVTSCYLHSTNIQKIREKGNKCGISKLSALLHINFSVANIATVLGATFSGVSALFGKWIYSESFCQWYAFEGMLGGLANIYALMLLCCDRFIAVFYPSLHGKSCLKPYYTGGIAASWIAALLWASLPMNGLGRYSLEPQGTSCVIDWHDHTDDGVTYLTCLVVLGAAVPTFLGFFAIHLANIATSDDQQKSTVVRNNKLVVYLMLYSMMAWGPFAMLTVVNLIQPMHSIPLVISYAAPLAAKWGTSLLPIVYDATVYTTLDSKTK